MPIRGCDAIVVLRLHRAKTVRALLEVLSERAFSDMSSPPSDAASLPHPNTRRGWRNTLPRKPSVRIALSSVTPRPQRGMLGGATDVPPRKSCKPYGPMPASHRAVVPFGTVRPAPGTIARVKGSPLEPAETRKDAGGELRDQVTMFWEGGYASCPRPRRGTLVLGRHPSHGSRDDDDPPRPP